MRGNKKGGCHSTERGPRNNSALFIFPLAMNSSMQDINDLWEKGSPAPSEILVEQDG
jgi:hypothetical protein